MSLLSALHSKSWECKYFILLQIVWKWIEHEGIKYPFKISDTDEFEKPNNICVNVFEVENDKVIYPLRITKQTQAHAQIHLLLLKNRCKSHNSLFIDVNKVILRSKKQE